MPRSPAGDRTPGTRRSTRRRGARALQRHRHRAARRPRHRRPLRLRHDPRPPAQRGGHTNPVTRPIARQDNHDQSPRRTRREPARGTTGALALRTTSDDADALDRRRGAGAGLSAGGLFAAVRRTGLATSTASGSPWAHRVVSFHASACCASRLLCPTISSDPDRGRADAFGRLRSFAVATTGGDPDDPYVAKGIVSVELPAHMDPVNSEHRLHGAENGESEPRSRPDWRSIRNKHKRQPLGRQPVLHDWIHARQHSRLVEPDSPRFRHSSGIGASHGPKLRTAQSWSTFTVIVCGRVRQHCGRRQRHCFAPEAATWSTLARAIAIVAKRSRGSLASGDCSPSNAIVRRRRGDDPLWLKASATGRQRWACAFDALQASHGGDRHC